MLEDNSRSYFSRPKMFAEASNSETPETLTAKHSTLRPEENGIALKDGVLTILLHVYDDQSCSLGVHRGIMRPVIGLRINPSHCKDAFHD
jgi:hypothetical protein